MVVTGLPVPGFCLGVPGLCLGFKGVPIRGDFGGCAITVPLILN